MQCGQLLGHEQRQAFAVDVDALLEVGCGLRGVHGVHERRDLVLGEPAGSDDRGASVARKVTRQPPQPVAGRDRLAAPRQHDQQRPPTQPPPEVRDHVERRRVRGVDVVEPEEPWLIAAAHGGYHGRDSLEQPHLRAGPAEWRQVGR